MSTDKESIPEFIHNKSSLVTHIANRDKFAKNNFSSMENNNNCLIKTEQQNLDDYSIFIKEDHEDLPLYQIHYSDGTSDQLKYEKENDQINIKIEKDIDDIYFSEITEKSEDLFQSEREDKPSFENNLVSIFPPSSLCNKQTINEETIQQPIDKLKKQCYYCQQLFDCKKNLISHIKLHCQFKMCSSFKMEENSYQCDVCQMTFPHLKYLRNHKKIHIKEKLFQCNLCYKTFTDQSNYGRHQKTHSGENPFTCHVCKKKFSRKSNLNTHIKIIHEGEKPFECDICQESFPRKYNLTSHYIHHVDKIKSKAQLIHISNKKHLCKVCQKSFFDERSLRRHEWIHQKNKPFQCDTCKLSFHRKDTLVVHIRSYHTGEKLFKCDICDKSFFEKNVLVRHKNTHKINIVMSTIIK
ncbi:zinc finger protein OZF-like [Adelges cooleyi]|uniref:zinc finger protein OZF-like n=1 Tax=Adelges cooleyi TaxID=133065 RepID=UPI00217F5BC1|nr:zinc finger protein OZF-like [Adelges cooleyi]XP_050425423.1 zinc finger protein OZF-like [Adelges cooleyi]